MDEKKESDILGAINSANVSWDWFMRLVVHACKDDSESGQALFDCAGQLCQIAAMLYSLRLDPEINARVLQWIKETGDNSNPLLQRAPPERTTP